MHLANYSKSYTRFPFRNRGQTIPNKPAKVGNLTSFAKPAAVRTRSGQPASSFKWVRWCGILVVLVYFVRGSVLPWFLPVPAIGWTLISVLALMLAAGFNVAGVGRWSLSWGLVLLAFAPGICLAEQFSSAAFRWAGLVLLILAVGPMIIKIGRAH